MRCPKCGYISFDHQESCKKCKKSFVDSFTDINGTVYDALAPLLLQVTPEEHFQTKTLAPQKNKTAEQVPPPVVDLEVREGIDTEFTLDEELVEDSKQGEISLADKNDEQPLDLDDLSDVSPKEEYILDLAEENNEIELDLPALDFGDLDISDLVAPVKEEIDQVSHEKNITLTTTEPDTASSKEKASAIPQVSAAKRSAGLEDLQFNGLDLEAPSKRVTGSAAGKKYSPSVKTGTALDKFDIDLGELFAENKT